MAKKKTKKKSKKNKKTKRKKSTRARVTRKKTRKIKKTRRVKKSKKRKGKTSKVKKARKINLKAPKLFEDSDGKLIVKVSDSWANQAYVNKSKYQKKYKLSIKENEKFWAKEGKRISWIKK